jgi:asparagine synthase (glutamine-hydrolysing)
VKPNAIEMLPKLVYQYEEPYADSSALPTYYVSKMTRDFVTVALNGDGGDENFAGYGRYSVQKFGLWYDKIMPIHKYFFLPISKFLAKTIKNTFFDRAHLFAKTLSEKYNYRYLNYIRYFSNELKDEIYADSFKEKVSDIDSYKIVSERFQEAGTKDKMDQCLYADFSTYLHDDLMAKVDIDSMTVALEGRSPFLDHEMLELTAQIPFNLKLKGLNNKKYILKEALRGLVPDEVMFRPKMGFGIPIDAWFRGELKNFAYETILSEKAISRGLFKKEALKAILDEHANTKINHAYRIWALITLELWFQEYFD